MCVHLGVVCGPCASNLALEEAISLHPMQVLVGTRPRGLEPTQPVYPPWPSRRHPLRCGEQKPTVWGRCMQVSSGVPKNCPRDPRPYIKVPWVRGGLLYVLRVVRFPPVNYYKDGTCRVTKGGLGDSPGNDLGGPETQCRREVWKDSLSPWAIGGQVKGKVCP